MTKLKLWQNQNTQIVTKLKNSNCDQTKNSNWNKTSNIRNLNWWRKKTLKCSSVRTFWHIDNRWGVLRAAFCDSRDVLLIAENRSHVSQLLPLLLPYILSVFILESVIASVFILDSIITCVFPIFVQTWRCLLENCWTS